MKEENIAIPRKYRDVIIRILVFWLFCFFKKRVVSRVDVIFSVGIKYLEFITIWNIYCMFITYLNKGEWTWKCAI